MRWVVLASAALIASCSHPLQIVGKGDIVSASGQRDCSYEQYSSHKDASSEPCPNLVVNAYKETYSAVPVQGWDFLGWDGCPTAGPDCAFDVPAATVHKSWGGEAPPLIAKFARSYSFERLAYGVVDAAYHRDSDTMVLLGDDERLHIYDVSTRETRSIDLVGTGFKVALSPAGDKAVVGHDGYVSAVDLSIPSVAEVIPMRTRPSDMILPGNGYLYVFSDIRNYGHPAVVDLDAGVEVFGMMDGLSSGSRAALHPSGDVVYAVAPHVSPTDLHRFNIESGEMTYGYDSIYHGNYEPCDNLWFSEDGNRIFTSCGNVFYATDSQSTDLRYADSLPRPFYPYVDMSHKDQELLVLDSINPTVSVYDSETLELQSERQLPQYRIRYSLFDTLGQFVFHKSDGSHLVVGKADLGTGSEVFAILHPASAAPAINVRPSAVIQSAKFVNAGDTVDLDASGSLDPEKSSLAYSWTLVSKPSTSSAYLAAVPGDEQFASFTADVSGDYQIQLVVSDGELSSSPYNVYVNADDPSQATVENLPFHVVTAAYSSQLDRVVAISSAPDKLVQYDINTGEIREVSLPAAAETVDVSPDGTLAVVGHSADMKLSVISLTDNQLLATYPVTTDIYDLVLAANGYAYIFPLTGSWVNIHAVDMASGEETLSTEFRIRDRTNAALHSSGHYIYGLNYGALEIYDVSEATVEVVDVPVWADWGTCPDIFMFKDGLNGLSACGTVLRSSAGGGDYALHAGELELVNPVTSVAANDSEIAIFQYPPAFFQSFPDPSKYIAIYDRVSHQHLRNLELPEMEVGNSSYPVQGRFLFRDSAGETLIALMQAEAGSGLVNDYAIYIKDW